MAAIVIFKCTKETGVGDYSSRVRGARKSAPSRRSYGKIENCEQSSLRPLILLLRQVNIMTDFVDAEIFLIDGDSLLLDLLGERSLDWSNGGQFLHLTYLVERFLQYFTDKG